MSNFVTRIFQRVRAAFERWSGRYSVEVVDDLPENFADNRLYAVGEHNQFWLAALKCPCRCGDIIQLPMLEGQRPRWKLSHKDFRLPTLAPSIDRTVGCRAHFWLKNGDVIWCDESSR